MERPWYIHSLFTNFIRRSSDRTSPCRTYSVIFEHYIWLSLIGMMIKKTSIIVWFRKFTAVVMLETQLLDHKMQYSLLYNFLRLMLVHCTYTSIHQRKWMIEALKTSYITIRIFYHLDRYLTTDKYLHLVLDKNMMVLSISLVLWYMSLLRTTLDALLTIRNVELDHKEMSPMRRRRMISLIEWARNGDSVNWRGSLVKIISW